MAKLEITDGGESVISSKGPDALASHAVAHSRHAWSDDRFYSFNDRSDGTTELSLTVAQVLKASAACPTVDVDQVAQAWENMAISEGDLIHQALVSDENRQQRESNAKVDLASKHPGKKIVDVRLSEVGTPALANGFSHYLTAYRVEEKPNIYVGGTQVYP